jgi:hypothetical protein
MHQPGKRTQDGKNKGGERVGRQTKECNEFEKLFLKNGK